MSDENVGGLPELPEPAMHERNPYLGLAVDPYEGLRALKWYSAEQMHAYARAALSAHGQPVVWVNPDDLANPHFVSVNAAKEGHEDKGRHYTLPLYTHGQPVVDERINRAWKLVERWEQPTIDGDTLTKEERLRNMGFAAMLRAALGAAP